MMKTTELKWFPARSWAIPTHSHDQPLEAPTRKIHGGIVGYLQGIGVQSRRLWGVLWPAKQPTAGLHGDGEDSSESL